MSEGVQAAPGAASRLVYDHPPSFSQQRMWLIDQMEPDSGLYVVPGAWEVRGELDPVRVGKALSRLMARHESLRTALVTVGDEVRLCCYRGLAVPLGMVDVSALPAGARRGVIRRWTTVLGESPFDLAQAPLWRASLLRLAPRHHVLLLALHHAVVDRQSLDILWRDLVAFLTGRGAALPELPIQFVDWAVWQRQVWSEGGMAHHLEFWREELEGMPVDSPLPADRVRPAVQSYRGAGIELSWGEEVSRGVLSLSREERATPFMALLACFQALLSRYAGGRDVCVGSPVSGRTRPEVRDVVGLFVNTLVLRGDTAGDPTMRELLGRVRTRCLAAMEHWDLPFDKVVEALDPERDASRNPLFQSVFSFQEAAAAPQGLEAARWSLGGTADTKFDLTLALTLRGGRVHGVVQYAVDLFDATTMRRLARHLEGLATAVVERPDRPLSSLPWMPRAERHQVCWEWATEPPPAGMAPGSAMSREVDVCVAFLEHARRAPEALAVVVDDDGLTYGDLELRSRRLALELRHRGIGPETRVALLMKPSLTRVVAVLAVLRAGGCFLPLDPDYPAARLRLMLQDLEVEAILTGEGTENVLPTRDLSAWTAVVEPLLEGDPPATPCQGSWDARLAAYVIYTSGSTGRPKGAVAHRGGLSSMVACSKRHFGLGPGSRLLQFASFSFDVSVWETFLALTSGATLILAPTLDVRLGDGLVDLVREARVDAALLTPSLLRTLEPARLPGLRSVVSVGERCPAEVARDWAPGRRFFNCYGPAECSVTVSGQRVSRRGLPAAGPSIGRPYPEAQLRVLCRRGQPLPIGVPGELFVGGGSVGRGYHGRPALTAQRFLPDAFGEPGSRLYRTGDRVRWLADGRLEFLGRDDDQVKVRGHRIEIGEVEAALGRHPRVQENVVVVRPGPDGDRSLVAYLVCDGGAAGAKRVRDDLRKELPGYMVPSWVVHLTELPRNPNGKVDRKRLPDPGEDRLVDPAAGVPRNELERGIAAAWQRYLKTESVGMDENFFDLGGQSLQLAEVHSHLRGELGLEVSLVDLFRFPTIRSLAGHVGDGEPDEGVEVAGSELASGRQRLLARRQRVGVEDL